MLIEPSRYLSDMKKIVLHIAASRLADAITSDVVAQSVFVMQMIIATVTVSASMERCRPEH